MFRPNRGTAVTLISVWLFVWASPVIGQQKESLPDPIAQIESSILVGHAMDTLRGLTDGIGGRLVGSPAYERAAEWAAEKFRANGLANVRLEPFTIPNGWQRGWARGQILAPVTRRLHVESVGWAPSTPPGGVRGEVIVVADLAPEKIKSQAEQMRSRVVLLDIEKALPGDDPKAYAAYALFLASYQLFKDAGVRALLLPDGVPNNVLGDWVDTDNAKAQVLPLPVAEVGMEDSKLIRRFLEQGPVTVEFQYENHLTGPVSVNNVIAEIPGSEKPDEWVLVGAHLDSWDLGTGAQDNGTGAVMVLEAARAIAALRKAPHRSIRFALWAGEEPGPPGSALYLKAHRAELDKCIAVLNTDYGVGHPVGWKVEGRKDLRDAMEPISRTLSDLGGGEVSEKVTCDTDHCPFMLEGIPALDLWVDGSHYREIHHKPSDTFDKVDPVNFKADAAIVAVTAYAIAQKAEPIAPHIDQAAVAEILKKANLDSYLVNRFWKP